MNTSLSPSFLRPSSPKFNLARVREGSVGEMGQQPTGDANGHVDSESPPQGGSHATDKTATETAPSRQSSRQPSLRHPRRRRASISLNPSYLRKVVGLNSNQDTSGGGGGGNPIDVSADSLLSLGAYPRPLSNGVTPNRRRRGSTSLSPTAVRAAMRSSIAKEQGGIRSRTSSFNDKLHESGEQTAESDPSSLSADDPQLQQRRRRFTRRSAKSFSLGAGAAAAALRSAIAMGAPGGGDKAMRETNSTTARAMPLSPGFTASEAVDDEFPDDSSVAIPATGDGAPLPGGDSGSGSSSSRRRMQRHGRSMSLALGRGASLLVGASPAPSPSSKRGGGFRNSINSSRSPVSGGGSFGGGGVSLRRRFRRAVGIEVGGILDTIPVWKRPELLKGLQER